MLNFTTEKQGKLSKLALIQFEGLSFSAIQKLLRNKDVKVNGKRISKDITLQKGDVVDLYYTINENKKFDKIYLDDNILVVAKKKGFTSESVFQSVQVEYPTSFFIHRLDRNTDGIMVFALNQVANTELLKGFKNHTFIKTYLACVYGKMEKKNDILTAYLVKDKENALVKIYNSPIKGAVQIKTGYEVLSQTGNQSKLLVRLYTGKTHQIRAHLAHIGHFILGDGKYGDNEINKSLGINKQMLTSYKLTLKFDENSPLYYLNNQSFCISTGDN